MFDVNDVRNRIVEYKNAIRNKRCDVDLDELIHLDDRRRELVREIQELRQARNRMSAMTNQFVDDAKRRHMDECREISLRLHTCETEERVVDLRWRELLLRMPSLPADDVPVGESEADNVERHRWGTPKPFAFPPKDHLELARNLGFAEFETTRGFAGSRSYALTGLGVLLEMAVVRFALDLLLAKGFNLVAPPVLVKYNAMEGTGYFPVGHDDAYEIGKDGLYLAGTAEVPLIAMQADTLRAEHELPLRFAGVSICFRREAGAAGRDTKGLYRVHQFQKVEQVVLAPADAKIVAIEHDLLLQNAEDILQALELPYRVVTLCTGEMGQGQVRKHDIETWMPSRNAYGETHSCSTLNDFQTRRLNIRYIDAQGKKLFAYTLNNTAVASPRILIPLLENHQKEDGTIYIPVALRPYVGGREFLS